MNELIKLIQTVPNAEQFQVEQHFCTFCNINFEYKIQYEQHMVQQHYIVQNSFITSNGKQQCIACRQWFKFIYKHYTTKHTTRKIYYCPVQGCTKSFNRKDLMKNHKRTHTKEKPYLCAVCNKGFRTPKQCSEHKRRTHSIQRFACHICHKEYKRTDALKNHLKKAKHDVGLTKKHISK